MKNMLVTLVAVVVTSTVVADDRSKAKEALQALNDYVGSYQGNGSPDKPRPDPKESWREKLNWGWKFKGNDCWLHLDIDPGKLFKSADLRFVPDKDRYQLTATTNAGEKRVYEGSLKGDFLILDFTDPDSRDVERLKMNMAGEGARFIYCVERKRAGRTIFAKEMRVECSKEGESLAGGGKKNECIVTGGLGSIAVSHKGTTYYVCCSGCKEAFQENPDKYVKEFNEKKKKGK